MSQLIKDLAIGSRIKFGKHKVYNEEPQSIVWQIAEKSDTKITLVTEGIIDWRCFDAKEPTNMDASARSTSGNNRYKYSNIRQWLNSNKESWYTAQHQYDAPPVNENISQGKCGYKDRPGFLTNFSIDEVNAIQDTTRSVYLASVDRPDSTTYFETVTDKIFLLSSADVSPKNGLQLFLDSSQTGEFSTKALKTPTAQCSTNVSVQGLGASRLYMLSYTDSTSATHIKVAPVSGTSLNSLASSGCYGVVVGANLGTETKVSNAMDGDGCYNVVFDGVSLAPTITLEDENLGDVSIAFSKSYSVNDGNEDDALTITEDFVSSDGTVINNIRTINNAERNLEYTLDLSSIWDTISLGVHRIRITVEDDTGNSVSRVLTFNKQTHLIVNGLDTTDYGQKYEPFMISYEVFGTGRVDITEMVDGNKINSISYNNTTPSSPIKRKLDLTDVVAWNLNQESASHTIKITVSHVNDGCPSGETITKEMTFTVIHRPDEGNYAPTLEIPQKSFGEVINGFTFYWTVKDGNPGNSMTTKALLDGNEIYNTSWTNDTSLEREHHFDLSIIWSNVSVGSHEISITANDGFESSGTGKITFTKNRDKVEVIIYGYSSDNIITRVIPLVNVNNPVGSLDDYDVYVCNNAYDQNPSWEDIKYINKGKAYKFINQSKASTQWCVAIKIESHPYTES